MGSRRRYAHAACSHQHLESALDVGKMSYVSWLFTLLLRFLVRERAIRCVARRKADHSEDNWADAFRLQWSLRMSEEERAPLGTLDEPVEWSVLPVDDQVRATCSLA